uniref:Uncharacterized protein n=1 Tax=Anguilla anguilla TaxID=7936 RepID=A0A0E9SYB8_ANGAN
MMKMKLCVNYTVHFTCSSGDIFALRFSWGTLIL